MAEPDDDHEVDILKIFFSLVVIGIILLIFFCFFCFIFLKIDTLETRIGFHKQETLAFKEQVKEVFAEISKLHNISLSLPEEDDQINFDLGKLDKLINFLENELAFRDTLPRMVTDGIYPMESSTIVKSEKIGRQADDLADVIVMLEVSNRNDTEKWVQAIKNQRIGSKDLPIFFFSKVVKPEDLIGWELESAAPFVMSSDELSSIEMLKETFVINTSWNYVIRVNDTDEIGWDFANYYYLGKQVMETDQRITMVCGGTNPDYQDIYKSGDLFWLSDSICFHGSMISRHMLLSSGLSIISMRPEYARVGEKGSVVASFGREWNVDKLDPKMMRIEEFEKRLNYDLMRSEQASKGDWDKFRFPDKSQFLNGKKLDKTKIYIFPYSRKHELETEYFQFQNVNELSKYKGIIPKTMNGIRAYIVPRHIYNRQTIY